MRDRIPLLAAQRAIMRAFYATPPSRVLFTKAERNAIWDKAKYNMLTPSELADIRAVCPALHHQIVQHEADGRNIQSAVFSECAYAQTLANRFELPIFCNCLEEGAACIPNEVVRILQSYALFPRYAYVSVDGQRLLIQAGGCAGVDSALISVVNLTAYTIEFKEPGAKASEPDLPLYGEDGTFSTEQRMTFLRKYPHFAGMLAEHPTLNIFENMGHNIHTFSPASIQAAIVDNYAHKKFADVICTEDKHGTLVMLPANQLPLWAELTGEIRTAGRNSRAVWTPNALLRELTQRGAHIEGTTVRLAKESAGTSRRERGGGGTISGLKINPFFFVRSDDCDLCEETFVFDLGSVRQLKPTIAAKMWFGKLEEGAVRTHYTPDLA